jgi:hypothetical protein
VSDDDDLAVLAVLADPDGERFVDAPRDHDAMTRLMQQAETAGEKLYCATLLGGCGQEVHVANGMILRPHFRHYPGSRRCPLTPAVARDAYTHRTIQRALVGWLQRLGFEDASMEKRVGPGSRVDVHCSPDAVIEVQLSPETDESMQGRTVRYGGRVTWLYHPTRPITSRDATLARDEFVLFVRLNRDDRPAGESPLVEVGIQTVGVAGQPGIPGQPGIEIWKPLAECLFTPAGGVQHPGHGDAVQHLATIKESHRQAVERAREVQRLADEKAAQLEAEQHAEAQKLALERYQQQTRQLLRKRAQDEARRTASRSEEAVPKRDPAPVVKNGPKARHGHYPIVWSLADLEDWKELHPHRTVPTEGAWMRVLRYHHDLFPAWAYKLRDQWAAALPEDLLDPAWATLYLLATSLSGQVSVFIDTEFDPEGVILRHFHSRGLISLYGQEPAPLMLRLNQRVTPDPARPLQHPVWNAY